MGFRWKIVFSSIILVAIAISVSGYLLLNMSYSDRWDSEIGQAIEENLLIRATLAAGTEAIDKDAADDIEDATQALSRTSASCLVISDDGVELYSSASEGEAALASEIFEQLVKGLTDGENAYIICLDESGSAYIVTVGSLTTGSETIFAINLRNVSSVFETRSKLLLYFRIISVIIILACGVVSYFFARLLTRPIEDLAKVSAGMAAGDYSIRCEANGSDEIGDLGRTFNFMAESVEEHVNELTQENRRKEEFVANFTHEVKTPMTSVIGYADMIRSRDLSNKTRTLAADYIFNEGMRLQTMSMKLFELFTTDESNIEMKPFALRPWVEDLAKSVFPKMHTDGLKLSVLCPNIYIVGDSDLLMTAFINVLDNARKASPKGETIHLRVKRDRRDVIIEVEDHGIGIPADEIEKITEAFYMVDKSRSRESGGAGLGLALTQKILKSHGTKLEVESEPNKGTRMWARFRTS